MELEEASVHSGRPRDRRPPPGGWKVDAPRIVHSIVHVEPQGTLFRLQTFSDDYHQLVQDQKDTDPYDSYFADKEFENQIAERVDTWDETELVNDIFNDPTVLGLLQEWQEGRLNAATAPYNPDLRPTWSSICGKVDDETEYGDRPNLHIKGKLMPRSAPPIGDDNVRRLMSSAVRGHRRVPYTSGRGRDASKRVVEKDSATRVQVSKQEAKKQEAKKQDAQQQEQERATNEALTSGSMSTGILKTSTDSTSVTNTTVTTPTTAKTADITTASSSTPSPVTEDTNAADDRSGSFQSTVAQTKADKTQSPTPAPPDMDPEKYEQLQRDACLLQKMADERAQQEIESRIAKTTVETKFQKCSLMLEDSSLETLALRSHFILPFASRPPLNLLPVPPARFSRPYVPIIENELVVSVALYNAHRPDQRMQEFLFLGSQRLSDLRDAFECTSDFAVRELDGSPEAAKYQNTADKKTSNSFIFIEGTFYTDSPLVRARLERQDQLREEASKRLDELEKQRQERYQEAVKMRINKRLQIDGEAFLSRISCGVKENIGTVSDDDELDLEFDDSDLRAQMEASAYREQPIENIAVENQDLLEKISEDYSQ